ncbi:C-C motif chemokine 22-like [Scomber scombrus]|uniref:C-C motif chemokine 22-like n=1 Tax=Scomber scombrus TaxID=13677 RepID=A0AAV1Q1Q9_SCOSC
MKTLPTLILLALICFLHHSSAEQLTLRKLFEMDSAVYKRSLEQSLQYQINPEDQDQAFIQTATHQSLSGNHEDADDSHTSGSDLLPASQLCRVTTVCDVTSCIDPEWQWAKNLLDEFETATFNNTSPSAPFNTSNCDKEKKEQKASG